MQAQILHGTRKLFAQQGRLDLAQSNLTEALHCAAPEGCLRTFVEAGETIRRLVGENRAKDLQPFIGQVLNAFSPNPKTQMKSQPTAELPEPLSENKAEVLQFVAQGLSNQEYADRLVISITTVKTHVGNIFLKLGVTSRTQAIARAEALGLLPHR